MATLGICAASLSMNNPAATKQSSAFLGTPKHSTSSLRRSVDSSIHNGKASQKYQASIHAKTATTAELMLSQATHAIQTVTLQLVEEQLVEFGCACIINQNGAFSVGAAYGPGSDLFPPPIQPYMSQYGTMRSEQFHLSHHRRVFHVAGSGWSIEDVIKTGTPWLYECLPTITTGQPQEASWLGRAGLKSMVVMPCFLDNHVCGVLIVAGKHLQWEQALLYKLHQVVLHITPCVAQALTDLTYVMRPSRVRRFRSSSDLAAGILDEMISLDRLLLRRLDAVSDKGHAGLIDDMIAAVQAPDSKATEASSSGGATHTHRRSKPQTEAPLLQGSLPPCTQYLICEDTSPPLIASAQDIPAPLASTHHAHPVSNGWVSTAVPAVAGKKQHDVQDRECSAAATIGSRLMAVEASDCEHALRTAEHVASFSAPCAGVEDVALQLMAAWNPKDPQATGSTASLSATENTCEPVEEWCVKVNAQSSPSKKLNPFGTVQQSGIWSKNVSQGRDDSKTADCSSVDEEVHYSGSAVQGTSVGRALALEDLGFSDLHSDDTPQVELPGDMLSRLQGSAAYVASHALMHGQDDLIKAQPHALQYVDDDAHPQMPMPCWPDVTTTMNGRLRAERSLPTPCASGSQPALGHLQHIINPAWDNRLSFSSNRDSVSNDQHNNNNANSHTSSRPSLHHQGLLTSNGFGLNDSENSSAMLYYADNSMAASSAGTNGPIPCGKGPHRLSVSSRASIENAAGVNLAALSSLYGSPVHAGSMHHSSAHTSDSKHDRNTDTRPTDMSGSTSSNNSSSKLRQVHSPGLTGGIADQPLYAVLATSNRLLPSLPEEEREAARKEHAANCTHQSK